MANENLSSNAQEKPDWLHFRTTPLAGGFADTLRVIKSCNVHTVCEEASCPNISECWRSKSATFLIMGKVCTRSCGFCDVSCGQPAPLDAGEPARVAEAVAKLGVRYVVITSVTRDDLADRGAEHFARVVEAVKKGNAETLVEVLTPDFRGAAENGIRTVIDAGTDVFGHNIEVVKRLHKTVKRPPSSYDESLRFLSKIKEISPRIITKTGLIVGVGERKTDVFELIDDVRQAGVDILSIGQYLPPSQSHHRLARYVPLGEFEEYKAYGESRGICVVESAPRVRSSYKAAKSYERVKIARETQQILDKNEIQNEE